MGSISVSNLGKAYKQYPTRWSRLLEWITPGHKRHHTLRWVLQDVSFSVEPGESVGIVGVNGAGKSTLLKMITGTTQPTTGSVHVNGRVAALLELGMGFHPDFTGRQNVFMAGQLQGLTVDQLTELMPGIERFADIGDYIDQPVRTYSSGMQVRLAFAVATAVRPDILIVDEALAVGDIFFQQKCFERIRSYREQGTTLLFVSHSAGAIYALCDRALLLSGGRLVLNDSPQIVIDHYNALTTTVRPRQEVAQEIAEADEADVDVPLLQPGNDDVQAVWRHPGVRVRSISILHEMEIVNVVTCGDRVTLRVDLAFAHEFDDPHVGFRIHDNRGEPVFMTNSLCMKRTIGAVKPGDRVTADFEFQANIAPGEYTLTVGIANGAVGDRDFREQLARLMHIRAFTVASDPTGIVWGGHTYVHPIFGVHYARSV
ncbi:ABC transporter ATP-binding protein [Aromatoleum evansii]|uniref:ABC transporter ATP-binding protein n=1 Tax=Aromatoleum evansii TaxID=59406 RepID=A0ABZ1AMD3_AROEV|nr:ABC transporter ATP-binding protein [Aromatoleum evansii]